MKYNIKEISIITFQKVINTLLLLRFKFYFWFISSLTEIYEKKLLREGKIFEDFSKPEDFFNKWDFCFAWGSSNNRKENIVFKNGLEIYSKAGITFGNWDGKEQIYNNSTGHVSTKGKLIPTISKVAAKIRLHKSNGSNQAFWLLDIGNDYIFEVDIFEYVNGRLLFTNHWGKSYKASEHKQSSSSIKIDVSGMDLIYEVVLRKKSITWKINGFNVARNYIGIPTNKLMLIINDTAPCEVKELPVVMRLGSIFY